MVTLTVPVGLSKTPTLPSSSARKILRIKSIWIPYAVGNGKLKAAEVTFCASSFVRSDNAPEAGETLGGMPELELEPEPGVGRMKDDDEGAGHGAGSALRDISGLILIRACVSGRIEFVALSNCPKPDGNRVAGTIGRNRAVRSATCEVW